LPHSCERWAAGRRTCNGDSTILPGACNGARFVLCALPIETIPWRKWVRTTSYIGKAALVAQVDFAFEHPVATTLFQPGRPGIRRPSAVGGRRIWSVGGSDGAHAAEARAPPLLMQGSEAFDVIYPTSSTPAPYADRAARLVVPAPCSKSKRDAAKGHRYLCIVELGLCVYRRQ